MNKFLGYMIGDKESRKRLWGVALNAAILGGAYYLVSNKTPGWLTYGMIVVPSLIVLLTSIARVNDMGIHTNNWLWHVRKLGFIMAGTASVALLTTPITQDAMWPSWNTVMLAWGVAAAWLTTPNMIPWWRYITGEFRKKDLVKMAEGEKVNVPTK